MKKKKGGDGLTWKGKRNWGRLELKLGEGEGEKGKV